MKFDETLGAQVAALTAAQVSEAFRPPHRPFDLELT